jgi:hypothetical protein
MATETTIPTGWVAFVLDDKCLGYQEFKNGGKYWGVLTLINKPTKAQLLAELFHLNIELPA